MPPKPTKQKNRSPQKVEVSSPEIIDADVTESAKSSKRTANSAKKRPAPVDSDSSGIEIIETPTFSKKAKKEAKPAPASRKFQESPSVTVSKKITQMPSGVSKKPAVGSIESDDSLSASEMVQPASAVKGKEKRISKPSAKVLYMQKPESKPCKADSSSDDDTPPPTHKIFDDIFKKQKKPAPKARANSSALDEATGANSSPGDEMNAGSEDAGDLEETPRTAKKQPVIKSSRALRVQSPEHEESGDEYAGDSEESPPAAPKKTVMKTSSQRRVHSPDAQEESEEDAPLSRTAELLKKSRGRQPSEGDDDQETHSAADDQIDDPIQKPSTSDEKAGSVVVDEPCTLISFLSLVKEAHSRGEPTDTESTLPLYEVVLELLSGIGKKNFLRALSFSSDGPVVNPANAHADGAGVDRDSRAVVAGARNSLLFITTGCVASCQLFVPGTNGSDKYKHNVKKIGIWPLFEEFDAMTAYFGAVFGVSQFYCHFINDILTFQTQKEGGASKGFSSSAASPSVSPKKASSLFGARSGKSGTSTAAPAFPAFVKYSERVPIYDIREQKFKFRAEDFGSLASLPLYKLGISDLPVNAVVTVGYTANTYSYNQSDVPPNSLALSLNIQFVLLHGEISAE